MGLHHSNVFNRFNLSSDLMEPFRVLVDRAVCMAQPKELDKETKRMLYRLLHDTVLIAESGQTVLNAIAIYTRSVFDALNGADPAFLQFWSDEL